MKFLIPFQCFSREEAPAGSSVCCDVEMFDILPGDDPEIVKKMSCLVLTDDGIVPLSRKDRRMIIKLSPKPLTDETVSELLLRAASQRPPASTLKDGVRSLQKRHMGAFGVVRIGSRTLMVGEPENVGRLPIAWFRWKSVGWNISPEKELVSERGIGITNPFGVIEIHPSPTTKEIQSLSGPGVY
jgi:hypothetical protein